MACAPSMSCVLLSEKEEERARADGHADRTWTRQEWQRSSQAEARGGAVAGCSRRDCDRMLQRIARPLLTFRRFFATECLSVSNLLANRKLWRNLLGRCQPATRRALDALVADLDELRQLQDPEDSEIAQEVAALLQRLESFESTITDELAMCDEDLHVNQLILEVTDGVGGQEAMLFAEELSALYEHFARSQGWDFEVIARIPSDLGGVRSMAAQVSGRDCFKLLRNEGGVHRVQRIPKTEKSGRVHTSTVAVTVIPLLPSALPDIASRDVKMTTVRSSGAGGQHVNKTESCVQLTHLATGISVECQEERSQLANRERAMEKLRQLLALRRK